MNLCNLPYDLILQYNNIKCILFHFQLTTNIYIKTDKLWLHIGLRQPDPPQFP